MKTVENSIFYLSRHINEIVDDIPTYTKLYKHIAFLREIDFTESNNSQEFLKAMKKCFRPLNIVSGTVGAFLFGCIQTTYGDIDKECSPICYKSINPYEKSFCKYKTWEIKDGKLLELNKKNYINKGYLFVEDDFKGLNYSEQRTIENSNIGNITLCTTKNSKHNIIGKEIPVDKLPRKNQTPKKSLSMRSIGSEMFQEENRSFTFVIIIFVFIMIFTVFQFRSTK